MVHEDIDVLGQMVMARKVKQRLFGASAPGRGSRYVPIERIGRGGGGTVYRAYDAKLRREVAIKLLHVAQDASIDQGRASQVMMREARSLAALSHPHIVAVHDVGRVVRGELVSGFDEKPEPSEPLFLVMEYIEGQSLGVYLREHRLSYEEILQLFEQASLGLSAAHEVGLVHRDFKPGNALVGKDRRVRVIDFGLAREESAIEPESTTQPLAGKEQPDDSAHSGMVGTPAYMSPEARAGMPSGPKSDQFSFAVALYEAVFGLRPMACGPQEKPAKMPTALHPLPEGTPEDLRERLAKALQIDPNRRYDSLGAMMKTLRRGRKVRLWKWWPAVVGPALALLGWLAWNHQMRGACEDTAPVPRLRAQLREIESLLQEYPNASSQAHKVIRSILTGVEHDIEGAREYCMRGQEATKAEIRRRELRERSVQAWLGAKAKGAEASSTGRLWAWGREIALLQHDERRNDPQSEPVEVVSDSQWQRCTQALIDADLQWVHGGQARATSLQELSSCWNIDALSLRVRVARRLQRFGKKGEETAKLAYFEAVKQRRGDLATEMAVRVGSFVLQQRSWQEAQGWQAHAQAWNVAPAQNSCPALRHFTQRINLTRDSRASHYAKVIELWSASPPMERYRQMLMYDYAMRLAEDGQSDRAQKVREALGKLASDIPALSRAMKLASAGEAVVRGELGYAQKELAEFQDRGLDWKGLRLWLTIQQAGAVEDLRAMLVSFQNHLIEQARAQGCQSMGPKSWRALQRLELIALSKLGNESSRFPEQCSQGAVHQGKLEAPFVRELLSHRSDLVKQALASRDPLQGRCPELHFN